ncbi:MAG: UDP-N-acetylmuramoyl-L-alanyl-D-glutamate--2,6-diaminopimelate ligase [Ruminococcaceae bacterium]|nr:UDP-N-acetylmuramoyl-L-alanyl-D-glutamate--2,6-diaminopimelate ligase [Oscillospiraceae bacterium]
MVLCDLLRGVQVISVCAPQNLQIGGIVSDSRLAKRGDLFIALRGSRTDGHNYIADAVSRGAAAVILESARKTPDGIPFAVVADTRLAAAQIWNNRWGDPTRNMKVIAITGTNGKTSTSYILRAILTAAGYTVGLIGTVRCLCGETEIDTGGGGEIADVPAAMTTPDPQYLYGTAARMRELGADVLILEASSHALAWHKVDALHIDCGIFTNLSGEHLDYHGTMDAYLRAKARLFTLCPRGIVNIDDSYAEALTALAPDCSFIRCSASGDPRADVRAVRTKLSGMDGVEYLYYADNAVFRIQCPVPGNFTVENTLAAVCAALYLGVDPVTVQDALRTFPGVEGRMERVVLPGAEFSLFLDYAHTPAALESLLRTVRAARKPRQKIILLFGCGGDRDPSKRPVMGRIASSLADFVILTSDNSRSESPSSILAEILAGMDREKPHAVIEDRREAIRYAVRNAGAGDILLFAGKGHEKYEINADGKHPFDEAELAREAYAAFRGKQTTD